MGATERATALITHNAERVRLGLPALEWNCELENDAARWARQLAQRGELEHASRQERGGHGENLWMGTTRRWSVEEMIGRFIEERGAFRAGLFPDVSLTGNWTDVGHYSQVVWRDTRDVGCALEHGQAYDVLVCRYSPAGNVMGRRAF